MKILQITPGAGADYNCDNCLRDTALVWALKQAGHDVRMITLYLPPKADRPEELSDTEIYFGGINVYLQQKSKLFRRTPRWVDWFFDRPLWLRLAAGVSGMTDPDDLAETTLSMLAGAEGNQKKELDRLLERLAELDTPDVVVLSNPLIGGIAPAIKARLGVPVACILQDEDAFLDALDTPARARAWALVGERCAALDGFVAVSRYYADEMQRRLAIDPAAVHVVHNAINFSGYDQGPDDPSPPVLGFLSPMSERWGLDRLIDAWLALRRRDGLGDLRLHLAGSKLHSDTPFVDAQLGRIEAAGLTEETTVLVEPTRDERIRFLRGVSALAVPTRHGEAFGKFFLEAQAAGVPVVLPDHGAYSELVRLTGGGTLIPPDDDDALTESIAALLTDRAAAREIGAKGRANTLSALGLERQAREFAAALAAVVNGATA